MDRKGKHDFIFHFLIGSFCGLMLALIIFSLNVNPASVSANMFMTSDGAEEVILSSEEEIEESINIDYSKSALEETVYTHLLLEDGTIIDR